MKKTFISSFLFLSVFFFSSTNKNPKVRIKELMVAAPFDMPKIQVPDFDDCKKFSITDFGALRGIKEKNTQAIAKAIDKANKIGGGTVVIPKGEWITGKIHFKSYVNLHLNDGAILLFSENPKDYLPPVQSTWEGMECFNYSPLIYAFECKNIAITGKGEPKAKLNIWEIWYKRPKAHMDGLKRLYNLAGYGHPVEERQMTEDNANLRPHFIQFNRCENVLLEGVTVTNSPFWTIHPFMSKNVVIRGVKVYAHGHNNDGLDPEMSQNVLTSFSTATT